MESSDEQGNLQIGQMTTSTTSQAPLQQVQTPLSQPTPQPSQTSQAVQSPQQSQTSGQQNYAAQPTIQPNIPISKCANCGTELKLDLNNAPFCPNCGYRPQIKSTIKEEKKEMLSADTKTLIIKIVFWVAMGAIAIYLTQMLIDALDFSMW
ncbi:hypothetical protein K9M79_06905 [Candidatus Woesearchaeota archaeon]|nr:hypothetical protein [Candidatus Woesearchaeota archaeon]